MENIKALCIATQILEQTLMLGNEEKQILESFCDKIYLQRRREDGNLWEKRTLMAFKRQSIDILSLRKVTNL